MEEKRSRFMCGFLVASGAVSLLIDMSNYGKPSHGGDYVASTAALSFNVLFWTLLAFLAWRQSEYRYKSAVIVAFMIAALLWTLRTGAGGHEAIDMSDIVMDLVFIGAGLALYVGKPSKQPTSDDRAL